MKIYLSIVLLAFLSNVTHSTEFDDQLELAKQGDAKAQYKLGLMYDDGEGVQQDDKTAVKWYTKAAEQENASAQTNLGLMYDNGRGVPENDKTAVAWYTKAAEQGNANAQSNLGFMYASGEGVAESDVNAYVWNSMAKVGGSRYAERRIDRLKKKMTREQIAKAQELAAKCYGSDYKDCN